MGAFRIELFAHGHHFRGQIRQRHRCEVRLHVHGVVAAAAAKLKAATARWMTSSLEQVNEGSGFFGVILGR